jgi:CheY-like chemotaxis protein
VLLNLLSNAIKFTERGRVHVALSSQPLSEGRVEARFSVKDTGPGIAVDDLGRLFVAFQQLNGSMSREHGGAGLGLSICKRLTELMGGTVTVETELGRGSTFHFTIAGEPAAVPSPVARSGSPAPTGDTSLRILLAEDEAINRLVILGMLEHLGYRADTVTNGNEVLQALDREPYDVVLMDIQMPGLDGLETARRIRSANADRPYIVALTAHALSGDRERCLEGGMNDYLSKPVGLNELQDVLGRIALSRQDRRPA